MKKHLTRDIHVTTSATHCFVVAHEIFSHHFRKNCEISQNGQKRTKISTKHTAFFLIAVRCEGVLPFWAKTQSHAPSP